MIELLLLVDDTVLLLPVTDVLDTYKSGIPPSATFQVIDLDNGMSVELLPSEDLANGN